MGDGNIKLNTELFRYETLQLLEQLEKLMLSGEKTHDINGVLSEVFRLMHTIKGSAAMMEYANMTSVAHGLEDIFFLLRENGLQGLDYTELTDVVLSFIDFIKLELQYIESAGKDDNYPEELMEKVQDLVAKMQESANDTQQEQKPKPCCYEAVIYFDVDCGMENLRAFGVIQELKAISDVISYCPADIVDNDDSAAIIIKEGFKVIFSTTAGSETLEDFFNHVMFVRSFQMKVVDSQQPSAIEAEQKETGKPLAAKSSTTPTPKKEKNQYISAEIQDYISVNVQKLDVLLDLVGELVVSETMVTQNSDLKGLNLENFRKSARQLKKIIKDLQDVVMDIRMVPLETTFLKMNRIVRDMSKKLNKKVELQVVGENTEVDKNIIEHIADPLMHLIRNAVDHGIEKPKIRNKAGKVETGKVILAANRVGSEVWITVQDDGKGLDKQFILEKAIDKGLVDGKKEHYSEEEIFQFIFKAGFSTKEQVSEFSGRGVGMDVVAKNLEAVGGNISVKSKLGQGTNICLKIPLTLAIMDGMNVKVGSGCYTIPTVNIVESFRAKQEQIIYDTKQQPMILIRGKCYGILCLNEVFHMAYSQKAWDEGIVLMVEENDKQICLFVDELIGEQQVVVKPLPTYINKVQALAGCTLLGDGSISLILDVAELVGYKREVLN